MIALLLALAVASDDPSAQPVYSPPPPADCSIVDASDASHILGYPVADPDEASKTGGICFYVSRSLSDDGTLTYAVVTADRLPMRRAFNRANARKCAPAVKGTSNELACEVFIKLALAPDMRAYYAGRASARDAVAVGGFGDEAVQTGNALYVRRGDEVFELSVLRGGDYDSDRTEQLATELLSRTK